MKDYKRLTKRNYFNGDYCVVPEELSKEITKWKEQHATEMTAPPVWYHLGERLCQLETKIENGTLIELPCKKGDDVFAIVNTTAYDNSIITGTVEGLAYIILDEYGDITFQHISRVSPIKPKRN